MSQTAPSVSSRELTSSVPKGFRDSWKQNLLSGLLVSLIALPLCLAISLASGYPAIAGIFTAVVGGVVAMFISNSELTIKGPAAGLIVIALGTITEMGEMFGPERAYEVALGIGVVAGLVQIAFAIGRAGVLGDFFPTATVHGLLAAIGIIIIAKQAPIVFGLSNKGDPLSLLMGLPGQLSQTNPEIAIIGLVSLAILFGLPLIKHRLVRRIPAQMIVILVAIPLGIFFDLDHTHTYSMMGHDYQLGPNFLVDVPNNLFGAITFPMFDALKTAAGWKWVMMFAIIGTLESMLSAKAVDLLDPWRRKTNLDRDNLAIGVGNTLAACIGGLPMISEIVRSRANIDNGARTRYANMFHAIFLFAFVGLVPALLHRIPLAALAAMLVYTGFRLASPKEFLHVMRVGYEQLVIFAATIIATLATDLLIGIGVGILVKLVIHVINGVPIRSLFRPYLEVTEQPDGNYLVEAQHSAVFSNWVPFQRQLRNLGRDHGVTLDLSGTRLVDHTVMEGLGRLEQEFQQHNQTLSIVGLENHRPLAQHPMAARKRM